MSSDGLEAQLHFLFVECDMSVEQTADALDWTWKQTRDRLVEADLYEPSLSSQLEQLDPSDVGDPVEMPESDQRRFGGGSA